MSSLLEAMAAVAGHELLQLLGLEQCGDSMVADGITSLKAGKSMDHGFSLGGFRV